MIKNKEVIIFPHSQNLFQFAAKDFLNRAVSTVNDKGVFSVVLAGGNTPKLFFDSLTRMDKNIIPWEKIQFFFGDERYVSSDNVNSNYHMAYEHLFSKVPINPENIYRIPTEFNNPKDAAKEYEKTLRKIFHIKQNAAPKFDLIYLGLGDDAHTASLMPFSDTVKYYTFHQDNHLVVAIFVAELDMYRITLTPKALNNSLNIIFLVSGTKKSLAVKEVLEGPIDPLHYPAQLIYSIHGKTLWYLDHEAAIKLTLANNSYKRDLNI